MRHATSDSRFATSYGTARRNHETGRYGQLSNAFRSSWRILLGRAPKGSAHRFSHLVNRARGIGDRLTSRLPRSCRGHADVTEWTSSSRCDSARNSTAQIRPTSDVTNQATSTASTIASSVTSPCSLPAKRWRLTCSLLPTRRWSGLRRPCGGRFKRRLPGSSAAGSRHSCATVASRRTTTGSKAHARHDNDSSHSWSLGRAYLRSGSEFTGRLSALDVSERQRAFRHCSDPELNQDVVAITLRRDLRRAEQPDDLDIGAAM